jgi:2-polyprenyl-3-methyl-5-hydroxy-6-metoxy-1,4-benzoquinol methylase
MERLDEVVSHADNLLRVSPDEAHAYFKEFRMQYPENSPYDPFSKEYAEFQRQLYKKIANRDYDISNEVTSFDVERKVICPYPYDSGSTAAVGRYFILMGHLMQHLALAPGGKVLEFGPGWGNTTLALATMGFDVTAVDIEPNFVNLIKRRCERQGVSVNAIVGDFSWIHSLADRYDIIMFFECFHHCSDHLGLLRGCYDRLETDGRLVFSAEPIAPDFDVPWGLRLDGSSLWAVRRGGWLELGYREDYFVPLMRSLGWDIRKFILPTFEWAPTFVAQKSGEIQLDQRFSPDELRTVVGQIRADGALVANGGEGYVCYGPYTHIEPGRYRVRFQVSIPEGAQGTIVIDACCDVGRRILCVRAVSAEELAAKGLTTIEIDVDMDRYAQDFEVRMKVSKGILIAIHKLSVEYCHMRIP